MTKDWILDVLADLQTFAGKNDLTALERQLAIATKAATRDLASNQIVAPRAAQGDVGHVGIIHRAIARGPNA
jgi:hypothetical protein